MSMMTIPVWGFVAYGCVMWLVAFWSGLHFGKNLKRQEILRGIGNAIRAGRVIVTFNEPGDDALPAMLDDRLH